MSTLMARLPSLTYDISLYGTPSKSLRQDQWGCSLLLSELSTVSPGPSQSLQSAGCVNLQLPAGSAHFIALFLSTTSIPVLSALQCRLFCPACPTLIRQTILVLLFSGLQQNGHHSSVTEDTSSWCQWAGLKSKAATVFSQVSFIPGCFKATLSNPAA